MLRRIRPATKIAQTLVFFGWPLSLLPAQESATRPVSVFVADAASGEPLVEARVEFPALGLSGKTDLFGTANFRSVNTGLIRIKVSKIGYAPIERNITLPSTDANAVAVSVAMKRFVVAQPLDTVKVIGKQTLDFLSDFERRRHIGLGKFFTAEQLDSSAHESLADQLTRRVTGVRAEWSNSRMGVRLMSLRGPVRFGGETQCFVQVYVDNNKANGGVLARIQSGDVAAIEYYSIAPPVQYSSNANCGVLLVWMKR